MMLTVEEMNEITTDLLIGRESRLQTPEARAFRKRAAGFQKDVEAKGGTVGLVDEIPDVGTNDDDE